MSKAKTVASSRARSGAGRSDRVRHVERPPLHPQVYRDVGAIGVAALGAVVLLALSREKMAGPLGAWLVMLLRLFLGSGVYLSPLLCVLAAVALARCGQSRRGPTAVVGTVGLVLVFLGWLHVLAWGAGDVFATTGARWQWLLGARDAQKLARSADGGLAGALVATLLSPLGVAGSYVALAAGSVSALLILTETTLGALARHVRERSRQAAALTRCRPEEAPVRGTIVAPVRRRRRGVFLDVPTDAAATEFEEEEEEAAPSPRRGAALSPHPALPAAPAPRRSELPRWLPGLRGVLHWKREVKDPTLLPADPESGVPRAACRVPCGDEAGGPATAGRGTRHAALGTASGASSLEIELRLRNERAAGSPPRATPSAPKEAFPRGPVRMTRGEEGSFRPSRPVNPEEYTFPPTDLLDLPPANNPRTSTAETDANIALLESTLADFNIQAQVVEIADGPTVTRYEIRLAPGIRVKKIVDLSENIAMSLAALAVRVEAPIPGKSAIGIEVPKKATSLVSLRECVETREYMEHPSKVVFVLGKDVSGNVCFADMVKMPHLLVAGATNSGKSVCLNVLIASMLCRVRPDEVKFILIDPKRVELTLFDGIPHLCHPVVKDVKQAAGILRWVLKEMERRYDLFTVALTRNIDGYNGKMADDPDKRLPYIVVVIDELADLMMLQGAEVETAICRLAQLARATGIHLVIATQRPSVDVITGLIKANVPSRIAFAVTSQIDSRTILDTKGAESLIGRGDMMFKPVDAAKPSRIQGAFVKETEVVNLVEFLKTQGKPDYIAEPVSADSLAATRGGGGGADDEEDEDDLFEPAAKFLVSTGHASTSMIQRKFKIGYTRAARLVDMMEAKGIVGPLDGARPREILMNRARLDELFHGEREQFFEEIGLGGDVADPADDPQLLGDDTLALDEEEPFGG
jgi:DNA segregation ATPase FtsK/SpoIIIE, S-DNA-T family